MKNRPPLTTSPPIESGENVLYDDVEYYHKLGTEKIVYVMNSIFGKPNDPGLPRLMKPPSMPWPLPDVLGEIIAGIVNAVKMLLYFIKKFIKLIRNFNDFLKFIAQITLYLILMIFLIIYEFVGRFIITCLLLTKEGIMIFIYSLISLNLGLFNLFNALLMKVLTLFSYKIFYWFYSNFFANEINPRNFYLNPDFFKNIYNYYPTLKKYLTGNIYNYDIMNNDNINMGIFLLFGVNYRNNGSSYINYNVESSFFTKRKEYYLPSFNPEILIIRSYMRNMYEKMVAQEFKGERYKSVEKELDGLRINNDSYNLVDMGEDMVNYIGEILDYRGVNERTNRIKEIQQNRTNYYKRWLKFKKEISENKNAVKDIFNIDIEELSNHIYNNLNLEYAKDVSGNTSDEMYNDVEKLRNMYYHMIIPYYIQHYCGNKTRDDMIYSQILQFYYNKFDYDKNSSVNYGYEFVNSVFNTLQLSGQNKDESKTELYGYHKKDILRKIIMNMVYILLFIGINNVIYETM